MDPDPNGLHTKRKQQRTGIAATSSVTLDSPYVLFHGSALPTEKFTSISSNQSKMIKWSFPKLSSRAITYFKFALHLY